MRKKNHIPDIRKVLRIVSQEANRVGREEVRGFAEAEAEAFKRVILAQKPISFKRVPLSETYAYWKIVRGLDPRVMIRTGHYVQSIKVLEKIPHLGARVFHVGFDKEERAVDEKGHPTTLPLHVLAAVHELGSHAAAVPARPHWRPHYLAMAQRAVSLRKQIAISIAQSASKRILLEVK